MSEIYERKGPHGATWTLSHRADGTWAWFIVCEDGTVGPEQLVEEKFVARSFARWSDWVRR